MKNLILSAANDANISAVGICSARVWTELSQKLDGKTPMVTDDRQARLDPFLHLDGAKSVIVCLFSYKPKREIKGNLSLYARGEDYHKVAERKLSIIADILIKHGHQAKIFCDTGDLCDRHLGFLAGLGFFGKNHFLINEKYGSYTVIGSVLTDALLEPDTPLNMTCLGCGKCIEICPSGALTADEYDPMRCVSYITQKKGELSETERRAIKKSGFVWGCDLCQSVCPHNQNALPTKIHEFNEDLISSLSPDMAESNRQFKKNYSDRAFSWRGFDVIKRNLEIFKED